MNSFRKCLPWRYFGFDFCASLFSQWAGGLKMLITIVLMAPPLLGYGRNGQICSIMLPMSGIDHLNCFNQSISIFLYRLYWNNMRADCWHLFIFILAADCFSSQRKPAPLASTLLLPTGSSSLTHHGIPHMTYRAYTGCTASVSSNKCLCTASWLR